jgi:hypothetical protein
MNIFFDFGSNATQLFIKQLNLMNSSKNSKNVQLILKTQLTDRTVPSKIKNNYFYFLIIFL